MVRGGPLGSAVLVAWLVPVWNELVDEGVRESPPPNTDKVVNGAGTWPWVISVGNPTEPLDMKDSGCFCLDVVNFAIIRPAQETYHRLTEQRSGRGGCISHSTEYILPVLTRASFSCR